MLQQLIKQTHCLYHRLALLLGIRQPNSSVKKVVGAGSIIGGLASCLVQAVLDTSDSRCLGDAGQKEKSRQVRLEARQLWEKSGRASPERSTVTLTELETGRGGFL
jgi:hypothetical protein